MSAENNSDYRSLAAPRKKGAANSPEPTSLKPIGTSNPQSHEPEHSQSLINPYRSTPEEFPSEPLLELSPKKKAEQTEIFVSSEERIAALPYSEQVKARQKLKIETRDRELLGDENWLKRNGHTLSYIGLYLFSIMVLFRPYELIPGLGFLSATAFYFAIATLAVYIPTQFATEGNLTMLSTEVKAVIALAAIALITMPIARDPGMAWEHFNDPFIKAVLIFIVMVNVIRTRGRLMGMMWLSLSIGVVLSYLALGMYMRGEMTVEGYRVGEVIGGMFENPNEMSMHLIMMIPIAVTLGLGTRSKAMKIVYFATAIIMLSANFVTFRAADFSDCLVRWEYWRGNSDARTT